MLNWPRNQNVKFPALCLHPVRIQGYVCMNKLSKSKLFQNIGEEKQLSLANSTYNHMGSDTLFNTYDTNMFVHANSHSSFGFHLWLNFIIRANCDEYSRIGLVDNSDLNTVTILVFVKYFKALLFNLNFFSLADAHFILSSMRSYLSSDKFNKRMATTISRIR